VPNERRQYRILFRDFLSRIVDLDAIAPGGDLEKLLIQFAALLAAFSFTYMLLRVSTYLRSPLPPTRLQLLALADEEFLLLVTMVICGLFAVLAWNSILPDRRDCLILSLLPIRLRTIFFAKVGAIAAALSTVVITLNIFTGLSLPFLLVPEHHGSFAVVRTLAAYWTVQFLAGLFIFSTLLALQGLAMQLLSYRTFLKASSFLQLTSFFALLGGLFLKPPISNLKGLTAPTNQWLIRSMPSTWFLGLFQQMNGPLDPVFGPLAVRALVAIAISLSVATLTFGLAWRRNVRRIVEQPDIAPADRTHASGRLGAWFVSRILRDPLDCAIALFTARSLARSRQHRLILAAFGGIGLAIALAYARELVYGPEQFESPFWIAPWYLPNRPFLAGTLVLLFFAVIGSRAVFALPSTLSANWTFRITSVRPAGVYFRAVKRALLTVVAAPVWLTATSLLLIIWPLAPALQHAAFMAALGVLVVEVALYQFRKIPFACSYLPGKANLQVRLASMGIGFLCVTAIVVRLEYWTLSGSVSFYILLGVIVLAAVWAHRRGAEFNALPTNRIQFEDLPAQDIHGIDLHSDGSDLGSSNPFPADAFVFDRPKLSFRAMLEQSARDFRAGLRIFPNAPGFCGAAVALIALGIGGNAAIFSIINAVIERPARGVHATGLVRFGALINGRPAEGGPEHSYVDYRAFVEQSTTIRSFAGAMFSFFNAATPSGQVLLRGEMVTPDYFSTLGIRFARGRAFTAEDNEGLNGVPAIINWSVWQNQFQGDPAIIGRNITLNGIPATIAGVTERGFAGTTFAPQLEAAIPLRAWARRQPNEEVVRAAQGRNMELVGTLAPGVSIARADAEFRALSKRLEQSYPDYYKGRSVTLVRYTQSALTVWASRQAGLFEALLAAVGLMTLLIVCANVANLMLSRAVARQREMAVRRSLGASRGQVLRMLIAEGLALSLAGAAGAFLFAEWASQAVIKFTPTLPSGARIEPDFSPDWRTAALAMTLAVLSAVAFAIAPAARAWRQQLLPWLKSGEQGVVQGRSRLSQVLVAVQIALCVTLLTGAGLATRSLAILNQADLHFDRDHLLLVNINTQGAVQTQAENIALLERLRRRVAAIPGIAAASYSTAALGSGLGSWGGQAQATPTSPTLNVQGANVGPGFLGAVGVRLIAGRDFGASEVTAGAANAAINLDLANALWPGQNPLGRVFLLRGFPVTVTAIAANAAYVTARPGAHTNFLFLPEPRRSTPGNRVLYLRLAPNARPIAPALRAAIREIDGRISFTSIRTMQAELEEINGPVITIAAILGIFSTGALFIAAIGLYAVSAFQAARRTRDFGIRMALGASSSQVLSSVLRDGLTVTAIGLAAGIAMSFAVSRTLGAYLIGVTPTDPPTYLSVAALLSVVSLLACLIPARRAASIDPLRALREE
jgi:predicted permease